MTRCLWLLCPLLLAACADWPSTPRTLEAPAITTRAQWGSKPQPIPDERKHELKILTVHHAGVAWKPGDEGLKKVRGLQGFGQREKGWPDLPYHYLIAPDGEIFEGRPIDYAGETNTEYDPSGHALVQLFGNFEVQPVPEAQLQSAIHLIAWLCQEHRLPVEEIAGHLDHSTQTVCPGKRLQAYISSRQLHRWVRQRLCGEIPDLRSRDEAHAAHDHATGS